MNALLFSTQEPADVVDPISDLAGREVTDPDRRRRGWECALLLRRAADPAGTMTDRGFRRRYADMTLAAWRTHVELVSLCGGTP